MLLFSTGFLLTFLVLELIISGTHIVDKSVNDVYDDIGRGRRANKFYVMFNEGFSLGRFNRYRYMGPAYPKQKMDNTIRIALLGDSFVEGFQVFDRNHFRKILEENLSKKLNREIEVLNFGRSGFDIGDMYAYNQTFVSEFNPDFSLYFISNEDLHPLFRDPLRMKVRIKEDSLLVVKEYPKNYINIYNKTKYLIQYSSIMNMLNNARKSAKEQRILAILLDKLYPIKNQNTLQTEQNNTFQLPEITHRILENLNPAKDIVINRDSKDLPEQIHIKIKEENLILLDLRDSLNILKKQGIDPYYWEATGKIGHWNHKAHKVVGTYIANEITNIINNN